jgi:putative transposase
MERLSNIEYRIYPSSKQLDRLYSIFRLCSELYNILLAEHESTYGKNQRTLSRNDLNNFITELKRQDQRFKAVYSQVLQNQADRLSKAFANFFRRCKEKRDGANIDVGYPRYKRSVHSITYPQNNGSFKLVGKKLMVSKIGRIPIVLHRPIEGTIKSLTIKRNRAGQFFAVFTCLVDLSEPSTHSGTSVGLDQGLKSFIVGSDGLVVEPPKFLRKSEKKLRKEQRRLSRKVKGSNNRRKQRRKVARVHLKIANQRDDWLHQLSRELAKRYSVIVVEDLPIVNLVKDHRLAKSFSDAGLGTFIEMLEYKVSETGAQLVKVNPAYTTQTCSRCGNVRQGENKVQLGERIYRCLVCGLEMDRDFNAAINIHRAGLARIHACGDDVRLSSEEAVVVEAGTIYCGSARCTS